MVFRSGKEIDNKVSEKEQDKEKKFKTIVRGLETEKENDPSPSLVVWSHSDI